MHVMKFNKKKVFFLSNVVTILLFVMLVLFVFRIVVVHGWLKIAQIGFAGFILSMMIISNSIDIAISINENIHISVQGAILNNLLFLSIILTLIGLLPDTIRRIKRSRAKARKERIKSRSGSKPVDEE